MGIQIYSNKGADPFRGKIKNILINLKNSSHEPPTGWNGLIFSIEHPRGKEIQECSNKIPRVMCGPPQGLKL